MTTQESEGMIPRDVEEFTSRLCSGDTTETFRVRRTSTPLWRPPSRLDGAIAKLLAPTLSDPGTIARLGELEGEARAEQATERRRLHDRAIKIISPEAKKDLVALTEGRLKAAEALARLPPIFGAPEYHLLTTPYLIWPTTLILDASEIVEKNSFATFRVIVDPDSEFSGSVRFLYYWTNPYNEEALINLDVLCTWNGYNDVFADGGIPLPQSNRVNAVVDAFLDVDALWDSSLVLGDIWNIFLAQLDSNAFIYSSDREISTAVHSGVDLRASNIRIPPLRTVLFAARVAVDCQVIGGGLGNFDYSSGEFQVSSPYALVTVLARYPTLGPPA